MLMSYDQWLTTLSHMVAITLPSVGMLCSAWTVLLMIFCTVRKLKMWFSFFVSSHVSEIHMSEAELLWECIMIRDKFSNLLTGSCHQMCVRLLITFLVASDLLCFYCIFLFCVYYFYLCVFLYFVFNFLHCSTGQKLMLLGRCILSILLFPFIFIVYLVYDFIINNSHMHSRTSSSYSEWTEASLS